MPKKYNEYNGFKVGDLAYVSDLLVQDGMLFLLDKETYQQHFPKIGVGKIIFICDSGYPFRKEIEDGTYLLIDGEDDDEDSYDED